MAQAEMHARMGASVLMATADERTIRQVALAVITSLDLTVADQVKAREVLDEQIARLKAPVPWQRAKRVARESKRRAMRQAERDAQLATADEERLLDELSKERPVSQRDRNTNQPEEDQ